MTPKNNEIMKFSTSIGHHGFMINRLKNKVGNYHIFIELQK